MFGYVRPAAEMLAPEERLRFQAVYCGLCHTLGQRYGLAGRMILSYDLTFLALLLQRGSAGRCQRRCPVHPLKKRSCLCRLPELETTADLSVILSWWQIQDGIADHGFWRGLKYRMAALLLRRAYGLARRRRPLFDESTRRQLQELAVLEAEKNATLDAPADTFARLLAGAADCAEDGVHRRVLAQMLYHLGRWIYLVDAADDLAADTRSGAYNPLPLRYGLSGGRLTPESRAALAATLDRSVRAMAAACELWDFGENSAIIRSVVYQGLYAVGSAVLDGTFHKRRRSRPPEEDR